jgi:GntR family transcriptional regulator, transcriptional repressor for pyruvate dehydrogenase complex
MTTDSYEPVKRQEKLSKQVADQIQHMILSGEITPGDRLPAERDLCDTFQVSRTVIREAISILEAKGLLESQGGSGNYVRALEGGDVSNSLGMYITTQSKSVSMMNLLEVRRVLEVQIARLAAERITEDGIGHLEQILASMRRLVDDPAPFAQKDLEFHVTLARESQNPLFEIILEPLADELLQLIYVGSNLPGTAQEACQYHRAILDRLEEKDVDGSARAMTDHLGQTERVTRKGLEERRLKSE